jgi:hypothetical protein
MFRKHAAPSTSRRAARGAIVLAGCVSGVLAPATAHAQPIVDVTPALAGETVAVGDVATGQLTIANHSTSPNDLGYLTVTELSLIPACSTAYTDVSCTVSPGADLGVFAIGDSATGAGACNGATFSVATTDVLTDKRTFTPSSPVQLSVQGATSTCVVAFPYTVKHMPTKDSNVALDGMQTNLVGFVRATGGPGVTTAKPDWREVTVERDTPDLLARASQPVQAGGQLTVSGTLTGTQPGGSMTFRLFGPGDPGCGGQPMYTNTVGVSGNGPYQPPAVAATQAGTYRWQISYSGDANNKSVSSTCNAASTLVTASSSPPPPPPPPPTPPTTNPGGGTDPGTGNPGGGTGTTPGDGSKTVPIQRVRLDAFSLTRKTFARASTATALAATAAKATKKKAKKTAKGTTIKYTISAPATVTIVVEQVTKGRRSGTKCVKATKKLKRKKACVRYVKASTIKRVHTSAGAKKVAFSGRAGGKSLAAGSYRMRATAAAGVGTTSATRTAKFKIVKR